LKANNTQVTLSVLDKGIGISPEEIPKLCQPFVQADSGNSRSYEGAGLGLSLVSGLVELHGGKLNIASELAKGTCLTITLPRHSHDRNSQTESEIESWIDLASGPTRKSA